jgi:hypothetical protein
MASKHAQRIREYTDAEKNELINLLRALNEKYCDPPKDDDEVRKVASDQFAHYMARRAELRGRRPLERLGLRWDAEGREYDPGEWTVTVVHSSPACYRLRMPPSASEDGRQIIVTLSPEQWLSARKTAEAIMLAAPNVNIADPNPGRWNAIWIGESVAEGEGARRQIRGLNAKLLEAADQEYPPSETKHFAYLASVLLSYLRQFDSVDDDTESLPNASGIPIRIKDELWLKWRETWAQATKKLPRGELTYRDSMDLRDRILGNLGTKQFRDQKRQIDGVQGRWILWGKREMASLEALSIG